MKLKLIVFALAFAALFGGAVASHAQTTTAANASASVSARQHLIGEVTAFDQSTGQFTVKTDAGASVSVATDDHTIYRRVPPGQTSLASAETITRADVHAGDRVLVPNGASGTQTAARQVIVMAREAVAARRAAEGDDWRRRGVNGRVASVDPANKEFTVEVRSREGSDKVTVAAGASSVRFLRYAPDSIQQKDATAANFSDIRVGDQARVLGNRDGSRVTAEEVVFGTIARVNGTVESVDAAKGEVTIKDAQGRVVTVATGPHTTLRRFTAEAAQALQQQMEQRRAAAAAAAQAQAGGTADGQRVERRGGDGGGNGAGPRGGGRQGMFDNLPAITLADVKKGDGVMVTGTQQGSDATHVTAASLVAGDAQVVQQLQQRFRRGGPGGGGRRGGGQGQPGDAQPGAPGGGGERP
jgi:hypothetical protein